VQDLEGRERLSVSLGKDFEDFKKFLLGER